jgi:hypothetical protein
VQMQQVQQAKAGEVAIVRNKLDQAGREHKRKLASVTKAHAEEEQKRIAEIEALKAERDRLLTEKAFQQTEMDELARKERAIRKKQEILVQVPKSQEAAMSGTVEVEASRSLTATPKKKSKAFMHRDGFEDEDVTFLSSPSRLAPKSRTPTKSGLKRKRSINGSPLPQLTLSQSRTSSMIIERIPIVDDKVLERLFSQDDRFEVQFYALSTLADLTNFPVFRSHPVTQIPPHATANPRRTDGTFIPVSLKNDAFFILS